MPLVVRNDIREMDTGRVREARSRGSSASAAAPSPSTSTLSISPAPPLPADRPCPAVVSHTGWIDGVLEADLGAPRKQRHTNKEIYSYLVEERDYKVSYSFVQSQTQVRLTRTAGEGLPRTRIGDWHRPDQLRQLQGQGRRRAAVPEAARRGAAALERVPHGRGRCPSAPSAYATGRRESSGESGWRRASWCWTTPPRRVTASAGR